MAQNLPTENNTNDNKQEKNSNRNEWFQFILALVIVIPFVFYVGFFHATNMTQEAKDILTMLGAFVGTIVGFYFGQRPIQNLTRQIEKESSQKAQYKTGYAESVNTAISKTEELNRYKQETIELRKMINDRQAMYESIIESLKKEKVHITKRRK